MDRMTCLAFSLDWYSSNKAMTLRIMRLHRFALVADRLSDGDDPDAMLGQLSKIKLLFERLAKEPAITVDEDQIERLLPIAGAFDHLLEDRSAVVTGGSAALDELRSHGIALGAAPSLQLAALVGNRKVVLSLAARRDPHVECGASAGNRIFSRRIRRLIATSHVDHLARPALIFAARRILAKSSFRVYSVRPKASSKKRAEIGLDDVEFALRYRDVLRKIVDDVGAIERDRQKGELAAPTLGFPDDVGA